MFLFQEQVAKIEDIKRGHIIELRFKEKSFGSAYYAKVTSVTKGFDGAYSVTLSLLDTDKDKGINVCGCSAYFDGEFMSHLKYLRKKYLKQDILLTSKDWNKKYDNRIIRTFNKKQWEIFMLEKTEDVDSFVEAAKLMENKEAVAAFFAHHINEGTFDNGDGCYY